MFKQSRFRAGRRDVQLQAGDQLSQQPFYNSIDPDQIDPIQLNCNSLLSHHVLSPCSYNEKTDKASNRLKQYSSFNFSDMKLES